MAAVVKLFSRAAAVMAVDMEWALRRRGPVRMGTKMGSWRTRVRMRCGWEVRSSTAMLALAEEVKTKTGSEGETCSIRAAASAAWVWNASCEEGSWAAGLR